MSSFKIFLKTFVISGWCLAFFVGFGYYYIESQNVNVKNEVENIPYYDQTPENAGLIFRFGENTVYTYLDFEMTCVKVVINNENLEDMGYKTDYEIETNYNLITEICDYFGGINLTVDAETLRYTGGQVVDMISHNVSNELRKEIISAVFEKMAQQGIGADFFNMIINQSKTQMKMPDCYFWTNHMANLAKEVKFITDN